MYFSLTELLRMWKHHRLPQNAEDSDSETGLLESETRITTVPRDERGFFKKKRCTWFMLNVILFGGSVSLCLLSWHTLSRRNACVKQTSTYSPVFDEMDIRWQDTLLNGSLWLGDEPSIWRGLPDSNATTQAWDSFETVKPIALTKAQVLAMGKDPGTVARFNDEYWHFGEDAYVGALDMFHQVHCLNLLRKESFRNWNRSGETVAKWAHIHWLHLQHCTDMLMQHLLCNADAGFLTYNWMEHEKYPFPDMSVNRKCRDWRQIVDYRDTHGVDPEMYEKWEKPEGINELQQPPGWYENQRDHHH
ncbi:hypothetical protein F4780DRAFT_787819 [Xylariomycetidae sp. FL0641]|nr:hypothetical protein F4780DRAFT_787819 [Xylariomycetidae sp. FL0641]